MYEDQREMPARLARIVPLLADGLTNAEIAEQLVVSKHTAEKYVSDLKAWYGARDRVDLVLRCRFDISSAALAQPQPVLPVATPKLSGWGLRRTPHRGGQRFQRKRGIIVLAASVGVCVALGAGIAAISRPSDAGFPVPVGEAVRLGGGVQQQAALADGEVTGAEYSDAYKRLFECLDRADIPYVVSHGSQGTPLYSVGPFDSKAALDGAKQVSDGCYAEHLRGLEVARAITDR